MSMSLFEKIQHLRLTASFIYDSLAGKSPQEKQTALEPVTKTLHSILMKSTKEDIPGCVKAITSFNNQIEAFNLDIMVLQGKIKDAQNQIEFIQGFLGGYMEEQKIDRIEKDGYVVTLTEIDGVKHITVR